MGLAQWARFRWSWWNHIWSNVVHVIWLGWNWKGARLQPWSEIDKQSTYRERQTHPVGTHTATLSHTAAWNHNVTTNLKTCTVQTLILNQWQNIHQYALKASWKRHVRKLSALSSMWQVLTSLWSLAGSPIWCAGALTGFTPPSLMNAHTVKSRLPACLLQHWGQWEFNWMVGGGAGGGGGGWAGRWRRGMREKNVNRGRVVDNNGLCGTVAK